MAPRKSRDITRADARALARTATAQTHTTESHAQKTERMGRAIAEAIIARGTVCEQDIAQAGFTPAERDTYYPDALAYARTVEPAIDTVH